MVTHADPSIEFYACFVLHETSADLAFRHFPHIIWNAWDLLVPMIVGAFASVDLSRRVRQTIVYQLHNHSLIAVLAFSNSERVAKIVKQSFLLKFVFVLSLF